MIRGLGRWTFQHRRTTVIAWLVALVGFGALGNVIVGPSFSSAFEIPASESASGFEVMSEYFPQQGASRQSGSIVFRAEQGVADPAVTAAMTEFFGEVGAIEGVTVLSPYDDGGQRQIDPSGTIAFATVNLDDSLDQVELSDIGAEIGDLVPAVDGVTVEVGGRALAEFEPPQSELIGLGFAIIVLILAFGSVLAMGLPIGVALFGVGVGASVVALFSNLVTIPDFATTLGAMIGIAVGIDYALFIVTRYRENLHGGASVERSVVAAIDTSGRAVLFAGITVIISLLGLLLMGLDFVRGVAVASALGVAMMMIGSLTLLPALLGWVGTRIDHTTRAALGAVALAVLGALVGTITHQGAIFGAGFIAAAVLLALSFVVSSLRRRVPHRVEKPRDQQPWYRWSRFVQRRPWQGAIGAVVLLVALAAPLLGIRLGFGDYGNYPESATVRRAYDLLAEGFGSGTNGPLFVTVAGDDAADPAALQSFVATLDATENVAFSVPTPIDPSLALVIVYPDSAPQDAATSDLVHTLRDDVIPASGLDARVGGITAGSTDFADFLADRMPLLIGVVLLLSFVLLMAVFRSVLVPLKAVIMNLLSIGAAYGVLVAVFQWGWGRELIGVDKAGPIEAWVPMFLFAIVFGLSMDYEVFLLSRIKEEYDRTRDNAAAVADGLAATARVITAAALIMFCVFGAFVLGDDRQLKLFGLGLAVAVLIDATVVRMLLVPATMELLGDRNWWIPRWLDRLLPNIDVEGHDAVDLHHEPSGREEQLPVG